MAQARGPQRGGERGQTANFAKTAKFEVWPLFAARRNSKSGPFYGSLAGGGQVFLLRDAMDQQLLGVYKQSDALGQGLDRARDLGILLYIDAHGLFPS